jgi:hypothetical protein
VSASGVYKILRRNGLQTRWERLAAVEAWGLLGGLLTERTRKELRLARSLQERHIEATRPGEVVHVDTFYIGKLKGVGKVWQYTACDAYGSYGLARLTSGEAGRHRRHGLPAGSRRPGLRAGRSCNRTGDRRWRERVQGPVPSGL